MEDENPELMVEADEQAEAIPQQETAFVETWERKILAGKKFHEPAFKRMKEDQDQTYYGAEKEWVKGGNYTANLTRRHVSQQVNALYAKNPKAEAKLKERVYYQVWDGRPDTLQAAMQMEMVSQQSMQAVMEGLAPAPIPMDPMAEAILKEVREAQEEKQLYKNIGKTMEIAFQYYIDEQEPNFKDSMKALVRRAKVNTVGWVKLGFQRLTETDPMVSAQLQDARGELEKLENLAKELEMGDTAYDDAGREELKNMIEVLQQEETVILREGPVFDFPKSNKIIVDPECERLCDLTGANWIIHEFDLTPERIKEIYKVDIGSNFTPYSMSPSGDKEQRDARLMTYLGTLDGSSGKPTEVSIAKVWEVWDKRTRQVFTICEGYKGYLRAPKRPFINLERFWPFFPLVFDPTEHDDELYPYSDVRRMKDPAQEYNSARQGLREHKVANRPGYVSPSGTLEDVDKAKLAGHAPQELFELRALLPGQKIGDIFQAKPMQGIDPSIYEVNSYFDDILKTVGSQESNFGGMSGGTATESSIAQGSRQIDLDSGIDELDGLLSKLAAATGEVMLLHVSPETIREIAGEKAIWPDMDRETVIKNLRLDVKAGSSGKPNRTAELANMERGMPFIMQLPGINPQPLAHKYFSLLNLELDDLYAAGVPSIVAQNAMAGRGTQPGTGDPASDPAMQGAEGGENQANAPQNDPPPSAMFPAPV